MNIQLGNLELKDVVNPDSLGKIQQWLDTNGFRREARCENIKNNAGNYHIFDIPRLIEVCGKEKMDEFLRFLQENKLVEVGFKGRVGITYCDLINSQS